MMLTSFPRRGIRRPITVLFVLGTTAWVVAYLTRQILLNTKIINISPATFVAHIWSKTTTTDNATAYDLLLQHKQQNYFTTGSKRLQEHIYRADGLLEVNPDGPHPIFQLIRNAEEEWAAKVGRASSSLRDAVTEYQRRYKRPPPTGFDSWWNYVEENNVQLPDEYDQIYNDLEPYWGMDPQDLQEIVRDWEGHSDSYTLGKTTESPIGLVNYTLPGRYGLAGGAFQIMALLKDVEEHIPPFRAVFSPHDNPNLHTDYELKTEALRHAAAGTYLDIHSPPSVKLNGWISACPPSSPALTTPINWDAHTPPPPKKTFIHNHRPTMDPCLHPSLLLLHGQFLSHRSGPVPHRKMIPQFSYCPTLLHHDIMAAMPINWVQDIAPRSDDPEWDEKTDERLHWRGSNTGIWHGGRMRWRDAQRARLVEWANGGFGENLTVLMSRGDGDERRRVGEGVRVKKGRYAVGMLDVAFAGKPLGCAPEVCEELGRDFEFRKPHSVRMAGNYKYILDVDGNGWSSRFKRLLTSNSLIFKSTIYPEWYTDRIAPWVHYIPVQVDLSDVYDCLLFLRGDVNGDNAHEDLARKIATAGREWSLKYWRKEDLTAYMFRLFLEYARVMNLERHRMNYSYVD